MKKLLTIILLFVCIFAKAQTIEQIIGYYNEQHNYLSGIINQIRQSIDDEHIQLYKMTDNPQRATKMALLRYLRNYTRLLKADIVVSKAEINDLKKYKATYPGKNTLVVNEGIAKHNERIRICSQEVSELTKSFNQRLKEYVSIYGNNYSKIFAEDDAELTKLGIP